MREGTIHTSLIKDCLANRRAAQRELYDRCLPYLSIIAKRYLREEDHLKDVLQDSFLQLFTKLHQFDANKASFKTWATRIVINNCLKRNARTQRLAEDVFCPQAHAPAMAPEALQKLDEEALLTWLRQMPTDLHTVFLLYVIDGFSHKEIATMINVAPDLSRQRLTRARKWLKARLEQEQSIDPRLRFSIAPLLLTLYTFIHQL
ncbi:MAG: sigma-70 family RNA polymerase sigma factor [Bacteroidota bacterium]